MQTILITGTSTGIGNAACELFAEKGWKVFAGSRNPDPKNHLHKNIEPTAIDVNDPKSITACFKKLRKETPALDCVVNNAGWGQSIPFEDMPRKNVEDMYRTNVLGLMDVCRCATTVMREQGHGTIVNISSMIGLVGRPLYSVYCSTKWAVEGFTESLAHELAPFGIRVKLVEPGGTKTEFHAHSYAQKNRDLVTEPYEKFYKRLYTRHAFHMGGYTPVEEVAAMIFAAATDETMKLRFPVGKDTLALIEKKEGLSDQEFFESMHGKLIGE